MGRVDVSRYNAMLPENIARIIQERGFKQTAIAQRAGFTDQQLSDMLNGRKIIKPCDVVALSEALGVTTNELFFQEKSVSKEEVIVCPEKSRTTGKR